MGAVIYTCFLLVFIALELLYFRIASKFNIVDRPNHRSSHSGFVIRGGGVIFPISVLFWFFFNASQYEVFVTSLVIVAVVSFIDDARNLSGGFRFLFHLLAVSLLLFNFDLSVSWIWYLPLMIITIGFLNAYNFMDGINGLTGGYSIITIITLWVVNAYVTDFISSDLLLLVILGLLVFNYFNFRTIARCFAGDVGSITMAFIISFALIKLITVSGTIIFIGFVLIYGLDAVTTICFRLLRRENIFQAHRSHFYQFLCNEKGWSHLKVSSLYMITQLMVNILIVGLFRLETGNNGFLTLFYIVLIAVVLFASLRFKVEGAKRLLG